MVIMTSVLTCYLNMMRVVDVDLMLENLCLAVELLISVQIFSL